MAAELDANRGVLFQNVGQTIERRLGIRTNVPLLLAVLDHPRFVSGDIDTRFLDTDWPQLAAHLEAEPTPAALAVARAAADFTHTAAGVADSAADPWTSLRGVRV